MLENLFFTDLVISYKRETLSARVFTLENLEYHRYSVFFNQQMVEVGPSHILISKRAGIRGYQWECEEQSLIQDEELAELVGKEIDRYFDHAQA